MNTNVNNIYSQKEIDNMCNADVRSRSEMINFASSCITLEDLQPNAEVMYEDDLFDDLNSGKLNY
jgi:hypothetical protein